MTRRKRRGPGRPALPSGEARGQVLSVRLTAGERAEVERFARQDGASASDWARGILTGALRGRTRG